MWTKIVWWLRFAVVAWVIAIGVGAALQALDVLPDLPKLTPYVWVFSLVILGVDNLGTLISRKYHNDKRRTFNELQQALMALLIAIASSTPTLRFEDLGASVYVVSKGRFRRSRTRLNRVIRFRPAGYPQQSGISWTTHTGAVGECVRTKKHVHRNWQKVAEKYGNLELTEEQYKGISEETRHGFTCEEFNAISGKYSEFLATPIWHGVREPSLLGVLTIDRAFKGQDDSFIARLLGTRELAATAASAVSRSLKPSSSE